MSQQTLTKLKNMDVHPKNNLNTMLTVFNATKLKHGQCLFTGGDIPYLHNG